MAPLAEGPAAHRGARRPGTADGEVALGEFGVRGSPAWTSEAPGGEKLNRPGAKGTLTLSHGRWGSALPGRIRAEPGERTPEPAGSGGNGG